MRALLALLLLGGPAMAADVKLASEGGSFTATVGTNVRYCAGLNDRCSPSRLIKAGETIQATNSVWSDVAPGVVKGLYGSPVVAAAIPPPFVVCPDSSIAWLDILKADWDLPIPAGVESTRTHYAYWPCDGHKIQLQLYTLGEAAEFRASKAKDKASIDAYAAAKPREWLTAKEYAWKLATQAELEAKYWPPVVVPPPAPWQVSPIAAGTRPYYAPNGAVIGKKLGDVATLTACDGTKRLGTTNYYYVPSVGGYSICRPTP
jgi:hypothetical protein